MGIVNNALIGASGQSGYNLTRSLRFRASASASLSRTPSSTGNQQKITLSFWVKRGTLSTYNDFLNCGATTANFFYTGFGAADGINLQCYTGSTQVANMSSSAVFRDPAAWYHIVYSIDMTQASSANGLRLYVNGVQQVVTISFYVQNASLYINTSGIIQYFGRASLAANEYLDGYLAEVNFVDGQALTPSSFGSTNALTGVWQPARYTGTYGTNGFYLPFTDNSALTTSSNVGLGKDFSGNGNYWTTNNISLTGGTIQSFTTVGTTSWTAPAGVTQVNYLVVAGGGAGKTDNGGGGGAGGLLQGQLTVVPGNSYTVTVGAGGTAATTPSNGGNSVFASLTAIGGGGGSGSSGGSGGGAGGNAGSGGAGTSGQGNAGGSATSPGNGGGGGAGAAGGNGTGSGGGAGGAGVTSSITGTAIVYAGGGGGGSVGGTAGSGGAGGGGNGTSDASTATAGTANRGGGGGGGGYGAGPGTGGAGGSGIVIISYGAAVTYDSMTDVPTLTSATAANFAVLNPVAPLTQGLTNGNLNMTGTATVYSSGRATIAIPAGTKIYWECAATAWAGGSSFQIGMVPTTYAGGNSGVNYVGMQGAGNTFNMASITSIGSFAINDVMGLAYDQAAGTLAIYKNNTLLGTISSVSTTLSFLPRLDCYTTTESGWINFGQRPFTYTPPTGFVALNTYNLPTSTIVKGNKVMDATLYTGTNATLSVTNAGAFKPDLVWIKGRSQSSNNVLQDSVRGANRYLSSNSTAAEGTDGSLTSFNSNGFSLTTDPGVSYNANGTTYVGWQWQAGQGSTSSNTSGSITSTVSVNASAGFSVVTYTGTGAAGTIGHGLGVAPSMYIIKQRSATGDWFVYHQSVGATAGLFLNLTTASTTNIYFNNTSPTSSVFSTGTAGGLNASGVTQLAYCWTPIAGYSAFGSFNGNGSTDGPMIYTGFQPKFVLIKNTNTSIYDWWIYDSIRNSYNQANLSLQPDLSSAETNNSNVSIDTLSNGFKLRGTNSNINGSGNSYIYAAFATSPFKNSLAF